MLLKYFYDSQLAHASYMVGCQRTGEAIVVDAARNIAPYLETAKAEGMRIVGAADTHIHADYVSGARELAAQTGAKLYLSDEGDADWKYEFAHEYDHRLLKDGDKFRAGNVEFEVFYSPGHTPEHISFLLTDRGGGANKPMGMFTGDFVFVGSVGRPDLLEKAAGMANTAVTGAYRLFESLERFKQLPDYLQVWPAHGAGSACGKGLGAVPSSTVGYEKMFNPMLQYENASEFVEALLDGQPEAPPYFAVMKRVNKEGAALLYGRAMPAKMPASDLTQLQQTPCNIIDTRPSSQFAKAHVPGTLNIILRNMASWAGWLVNYQNPVYLITTPNELPNIVRVMAEVGIDQLAGYFDPIELSQTGFMTESYTVKRPAEIANAILQKEVTLIDIRAQSEWNEGHLPNARHIMLGYLGQNIAQIPTDKPVVLQCQSGNRSAIAASLLQAKGVSNVVNLAGGIAEWQRLGLPVEMA